MLTPHDAADQLQVWRVPAGKNRYAAVVDSLPEHLREPAQLAFRLRCKLVPASGRSLDLEQVRKEQLAQIVPRLSRADLGALFDLMGPGLQSALQEAWDLLGRGTYQTNFTRKAFRAPQDPSHFVDRRVAWLLDTAAMLGKFQPQVLSPVWLATWGAHLGHGTTPVLAGLLLAATLHGTDPEADEAFEILRLSLLNQHETGAMGRHLTTAFLLSNRPAAWELMERTLLAAQRQEGLRQVILEQIDESHPEAFRRMLRLILEHDLIRFSSVVRAVDVWFGQLWTSATPAVIKQMLTMVVEFLELPESRERVLTKRKLKPDDAESVYLALWCAATENAVASISLAEKLLGSPVAEIRYVAVRHLVNLALDEAQVALAPAIDDADLRVAALALSPACCAPDKEFATQGRPDDRFERLERQVARLSIKRQSLKPIVWPWTAHTITRAQFANCLPWVGRGRHPEAYRSHLSYMDSNGRQSVVHVCTKHKPLDEAARAMIVSLAGDASEGVRNECLSALEKLELTASEAVQIESYLRRSAGPLRQRLLRVLLAQTDHQTLASAQRLLTSSVVNQRLAGLELLRLLADSDRSAAKARKLMRAFQEGRKTLSQREQTVLDAFSVPKSVAPTLENALGLMSPAGRTPVVAPRHCGVLLGTLAAFAILEDLDRLIYENRNEEVRLTMHCGTETLLLGNVRWQFPSPQLNKPLSQQEEKLPLADVWQRWFAQRPAKCRDEDGLELVRASALVSSCGAHEQASLQRWGEQSQERTALMDALFPVDPLPRLRNDHLVKRILEWLLFLHPLDTTDYLLDAIETAYSLIPAQALDRLTNGESDEVEDLWDDEPINDWRELGLLNHWNAMLSPVESQNGLTDAQLVRYWRLAQWYDEPIAGAIRRRVDTSLMLRAYAIGAATLSDMAEHLLGSRGQERRWGSGFAGLEHLTSRSLSGETQALLNNDSDLRGLVDRARARILEIELVRGDMPTVATLPAHGLGSLFGVDTLCRILTALGKSDFRRPSGWQIEYQLDRATTLSRLAKVTLPGPTDNPELFGQVIGQAVSDKLFPRERVLQLAFLAPQWTQFVESFFAWPHLSEGVYWFLAHMRDQGESTAKRALEDQKTEDDGQADTEAGLATDVAKQDETIAKVAQLSAWERLLLQRTSLTANDRAEGAIDVAWFRRAFDLLGPRHWHELALAARFAATSAQAARALFVGKVLQGKVSRSQLVDGIKRKHLKESVRLLGLLPLAAGEKRESDLRERCRVLRDYRRYANQLSGLTKPSALLSYEIGMKNLAQTAGYADPLRLEWSVSAEEVNDLSQGAVAVKCKEVIVTLVLDEFAQPHTYVEKRGKPLKSVPADIKKDKKVAALLARVVELKRQTSSIRQSLELAMCRGEAFSGRELQSWCQHALVGKLLSRLVIVGEGIYGYPVKGGKALQDCHGKLEPVKVREALRIAHPHDLLSTGKWHDWQRECFLAERVQPVKQVFRELYVLTDQERKDGTISHRYDGHQVQDQKAQALFARRGWNAGQGVFKTFHDVDITAEVCFNSGRTTPLEVEGATLDGIQFVKRGDWKPIELSQVPGRLFSEVMRDVDLVVSVAHAGGVDPEASASTVEMRSALLLETCRLLGLSNVSTKGPHVLIAGKLAEYNIHLGSGSVQRMPGGSLCIVPVHAQHRGRLFLPFADDDPRTAEVISKALLLARDHEIQDPSILEQIRQST